MVPMVQAIPSTSMQVVQEKGIQKSESKSTAIRMKRSAVDQSSDDSKKMRRNSNEHTTSSSGVTKVSMDRLAMSIELAKKQSHNSNANSAGLPLGLPAIAWPPLGTIARTPTPSLPQNANQSAVAGPSGMQRRVARSNTSSNQADAVIVLSDTDSDGRPESVPEDRQNKRKRKSSVPTKSSRKESNTTTTKFKRQKGVKPEDQTSKSCFTSVKMKLASVINGKDNPIKRLISLISIKATKIASLASLLMLVKVNDNIDDPRFFDLSAEEMVEECFFEVLNPIKTGPGRRRVPKFPQYISQRFINEMVRYRIVRPDNDQMGNMFRYLHQQYASTFETNICTHGYQRIFNFFKTIDGSTKRQRRTTMDFLFNDRSTGQPNQNLINALTTLPHNSIPLNTRCALMSFKDEWFRYVPLFVSIQRSVYSYNMRNAEEWRQEDEEVKADRKKKKMKGKHPRVRPMNIVPITKYKRQHIRIDSEGLFHFFAVLKQLPKQNGTLNINTTQFKQRQHEFWSQQFDMNRIDEICRSTPNKKDFAYQVLTDGMSVSLLYNAVPKKRVDVDAKVNRIRRNVNNGQYQYHTSIDVGYNTYIAAVRKTVSSGKEVNQTLKAKQFHRNTKNSLRKKKFKRLADEFETKAARDRENKELYAEIPTPTGPYYWLYVQHCLKFWDERIATYTTPQYASMSFDKYTNTQTQIDSVLKKLTNGKPTLMFIGGAEFSPNSPIKGHVRCPSIRKVTRSVTKHKQCDYLFVDEFNTSQHCGLCLNRFGRETKAYRFKRCFKCGRAEDVVPKAPIIVSHESKRKRQMSRILFGEQTPYRSRRFLSHPTTPSTTWHRDITACRLIGYKGLNALLNRPIDARLLISNLNPNNGNGTDDGSDSDARAWIRSPIIW